MPTTLVTRFDPDNKSYRRSRSPSDGFETRRLSALLDGLTLQAVRHPDLVGPDELRAVLRRHLDSLADAAS